MEEEIKKLKDELFYKPENAAAKLSDEEIAAADAFCEGYKAFLDTSKTERDACDTIERIAKENGFAEYVFGQSHKPGDRVYYNNRGKAIIMCVFGKRSAADGVKITAAHIDCPRLDLKPNPIYEDGGLGFFKTHYYGGVKKYQWTTIPLALHGVIIKADGESVKVNIGEDEGDPKFIITDLLPHLAAEQKKRTLDDGIKAEELNLLIGSRPFKGDDGSEAVKLNILKILNDKYGVTGADFLSAELEVVPAYKACDIGFDRSMIGACGHDDRVDAYPAVMAAVAAKEPEYTCLSVLTDKEEIGSDGTTGLNSSYMKYFINDIARAEGLEGWQVLRKSECLSADVTAAYDPTFPDVMDKLNSAYINNGVSLIKYTGSRGKYGTSDAPAEFVGRIRRLLDANGVVWQLGALGKVDAGGGGTVARFVAELDVDTVDIGVPVLSMHAPMEVVSKLDVYMAYKAFAAFFSF